MSAYEPPTIISTIYNPAFFEASATNTITQAQANALYLKKKTADTATALETFSAGINTTSLAASSFATVGTTLGVTGVLTASGNINTPNISTGSSGTLSLGGTDTIELGCNNTRGAAPISIGTGGTGQINLSTGITNTIRLFSSTQGTNLQYDNTNLISNTASMSLYNTQVSGALNIGTSATRTGAINLGASGGTHLINIDTSSTSATAIQIGTSASAKTVKINNSTGSVHISAIDIQGTGINGTVPLTGNISLANLQTSGVLNIGTAARLLTGNGGAINIGTGSGAIVNPINIGGAGSSISIAESLVITGTSSSAFLNSNNVSTDITIGSNQTSGNIEIGIGTGRTSSGAINIGTGGTAVVPITIGNINSTTSLLGTTTISSLGINSVDRVAGGQLSIAPSVATSLVLGNATTCNTSNLGTLTSTGLITATAGLTSSGTLTAGNILEVVVQGGIFKVGRPADSAFWISSNSYTNGVYLAQASGAGWVNVSDITLKENIELLPSMLDKLNELKPCQYNYIGNQDEICMGFIAQELQNQFPNLIYKSSDKLGIAYTGLIPVIIKALQEQQVQINSLKDELKLLSAKIV